MDKKTKQLINLILNDFDIELAPRMMSLSMIIDEVKKEKIIEEIGAIELRKRVLKKQILKVYPDIIFKH